MSQDKLNTGSLEELPSKDYQKFFDKFKLLDSTDTKDWNPTLILAYFCKRYKDHYNTDYKFKFNTSAPSKCFEVFQIKRLANLLSSDPLVLKQYIDWVFETKVLNSKRRLTSISFLTVDKMVHDYKMKFLFKPSITRASYLPDYAIEKANELGLKVKTYGDLSFMIQANEGNSLPEELSENINDLVVIMRQNNFDLNILSKLT